MPAEAVIGRARRDLLEIYSAAVDAVRGQVCVRHELVRDPPAAGPVWLVAIGKAAESMALGALELLEEKGVFILEDTVRRGLTQVRWPGGLDRDAQ